MSPAIVRRIMFPLHEALLRRPTLSILRWLERGALAQDESAAAYQGERIAALVEHARRHVPYWRERSGQESATLPVTTRAQVRAHRESMRWPEAPGKLIRHSSSGTTDDNLSFYLDRERQAWHRALRIRALARLGVELGEKQLHYWPHFAAPGASGPLKDTARAVRDCLTNDVVFDLRPMTPARLDAALALLERYRPVVLVGYPSWLFALAEHHARTGRRLRARPRLVLSTGELLYAFQRRAIEAAFGVRVVEEYGSQDVGLIASEDADGRWRVSWEHVAVEVSRDGCWARPGELGEIVATNLHSHVMPFLRYATGDVVRMPLEPNPERSDGDRAPLTVLPPIEGRASDVPVGTDGQPHSNRGLVEALVRETGTSQFSLHQTAPDFVLCLSVREGGLCGQESRVTGLLRSYLGGALRVDWRIGGAFHPLKSGKRRFVCSAVGHSLLAHDRESGMSLARAWPQQVLGEA